MKAKQRIAAAPSAAPDTIAAATEPPLVALPYLVGKWHGITQYQCRQCPFDSLDEGAILEHVAGHMAAERAPARSGLVLVADKNGREIE